MTKLQRLEERVRLDDRICAEINEILDRLDYTGRGMAGALGRIGAVLSRAGRRKEKTFDGADITEAHGDRQEGA
jgi:hypothetical protein